MYYYIQLHEYLCASSIFTKYLGDILLVIVVIVIREQTAADGFVGSYGGRVSPPTSMGKLDRQTDKQPNKHTHFITPISLTPWVVV